MDEQFKDKDPLLMDLVKEAGLDQAGPDFTKNVMARLQPKGVAQEAVYRPLIGKKAWVVIGLIALAVLLFVLLVPVGALPWTSSLAEGWTLPETNWDLQLSKTSMYALGCLALFLIQIPFLKRYLEQRV